MQPRKLILFGLGALAFLLALTLEFSSPYLLNAPSTANLQRPGIGISSLAYLDLVFAYSLVLIGIDFLPGIRTVFARIQGILTLVLSLLGLIGSIVLAFLTFAFLMLMVSLLMTVPFGTIAYFAASGHFDVASAKIILCLAMFLKLVGVGLIFLANMAFLKNKGFMFLTICSVGLSFVLGLLHTFPPGFLVSITDAIGALVITIVVIVWTVILLIGSLFAILRAIRSLIPS